MKKSNTAYRWLSGALACAVLIAISGNAVAVSESSSDTEAALVSYESLPNAIQSICTPDSKIYKNADGGYDIYLPKSSQCGVENAPRAVETPIPGGGSWTGFMSPDVEGGTLKVVGLSYIPQEVVSPWLVNNSPGFWAAVRDTVVGGIVGGLTVTVVTAIAADFGMVLPPKVAAAVVTAVSTGAGYISSQVFNIKYNTVLDAQKGGTGIIVTSYIMPITPGSGIIKTYAGWDNFPYVINKPYGATTWHPSEFYAAL